MNKTFHSNSLVEDGAIDADAMVLMTEWTNGGAWVQV